jgi:uncharacterized membrane protein
VDWLLFAFKFVHVAASASWIGADLVTGFYLYPALRRIERPMERLARWADFERTSGPFFGAIGILTVVGGYATGWRMYGPNPFAWGTHTLLLGALLGVVGFAIGLASLGPSARLARLAATPWSDGHDAEAQVLYGQLERVVHVITGLVVVAMAAMVAAGMGI